MVQSRSARNGSKGNFREIKFLSKIESKKKKIGTHFVSKTLDSMYIIE